MATVKTETLHIFGKDRYYLLSITPFKKGVIEKIRKQLEILPQREACRMLDAVLSIGHARNIIGKGFEISEDAAQMPQKFAPGFSGVWYLFHYGMLDEFIAPCQGDPFIQEIIKLAEKYDG